MEMNNKSTENIVVRNKFKSTLANFLTSQLHCDATFVFKDENGKFSKVGAHKVILSAASEVFETMFYGETVKNNTVKQDNELDIKDISFDAFKSLLDFIYGKEVKFYDFKSVVEFYGAAHKYICTDAMIFAESKMMKEVDSHNVIAFYNTAVLYELPELKKNCLDVFTKKTSNILKSAEFLFVTPELVNTIFNLKKKTLDSEVDLVYALERYIRVNEQKDGNIKEKVQTGLNAINFQKITAQEINKTFLLTPEAKKTYINSACTKIERSEHQDFDEMFRELSEFDLFDFCELCKQSIQRTIPHKPTKCPNSSARWRDEHNRIRQNTERLYNLYKDEGLISD